MFVGVVQIGDVQPVRTETLEALLNGTEDAVAGEVPNAFDGCRNDESFGVELIGSFWAVDEQTADLGGDDVFVTWDSAERRAKPPL